MDSSPRSEPPNFTATQLQDEGEDTSGGYPDFDRGDFDSDTSPEPDVDELESEASAAGMGNIPSTYDGERLTAVIDSISQAPTNHSRPSTPREPSSNESAPASPESSRDKTNEPHTPERKSSRPNTASPSPQASSSKEPDKPNRRTARFSCTTSPPQDVQLDAPAETPRPFPLSPPQPSQTLDPSPASLPSPEPSTASDWDEMMPSVEDMLSMTQPSYNSPTQNQSKASKGRSRTATENTMDIDTTKAPRPSPVKRQRPETPPLPKSSWKKPKVEETEEAEPIHYIEILDSSSGSEREEPRHSKNTEPKSKSRRALPSQTKGSQKARRKRTPSPVASASTSRQPFQQRPVTPPRKPPRKRAKAGSYTKHPVHWHLDGSVLIQIGSMRFKLHRSVLVRHSEWFQHTFERGEDAPERASELVDNLPLYYLDQLGVDPHNFSVLLHAVDDAITYVETEPPFDTIASILLASSALTFTKFEAYAIRYLETMWSPDLADLTKIAIPYAFESMILARECALFSVLKRVMYELVRMQGFGQPAPTPDNRAPAVTLNAQDLNTLLHAREKLMTVWTAAADPDEFPPCAAEPEPLPQAGVPPPGAATHGAQQVLAADAPAAANPLPDAPLPRPCTATSRVDSKLAHDNLVKTTGVLKTFRWDPLCGLQAMIEAPWDAEGFCEACVENRREVWEGERERVWEELDEWFGL